ncbi:unnamed protein product [Symbiodinium pilosum]|uniref:Uncharacterized protein n=1 Tax=Symbiodinium pilosum TaxID=2952 RepID=A0A812RPI6_SYMPI|nr:unnamed protein product [Symbiodinium pilosum]
MPARSPWLTEPARAPAKRAGHQALTLAALRASCFEFTAPKLEDALGHHMATTWIIGIRGCLVASEQLLGQFEEAEAAGLSHLCLEQGEELHAEARCWAPRTKPLKLAAVSQPAAPPLKSLSDPVPFRTKKLAFFFDGLPPSMRHGNSAKLFLRGWPTKSCSSRSSKRRQRKSECWREASI